jgi:predicted RNA binding protein YcfA (HicA-like mRNA interferase family)
MNEFRTVLGRNGFEIGRQGANHEIRVRHDAGGRVDRRVPVSHGNAEIRTKRLFRDMLKQAGKTEEHFYEVLG